jgi:hypothetical protein
MAEDRRPMDREDLARLVGAEIDDARQYAREMAPDREVALRFIRGDVDIPAEPGKSGERSGGGL